jgi:hypothetical protein
MLLINNYKNFIYHIMIKIKSNKGYLSRIKTLSRIFFKRFIKNLKLQNKVKNLL